MLFFKPGPGFLSYYLERSDRRLEGGSIPLRLLTKIPLQEFEDYLDSVTRWSFELLKLCIPT